MAIEEYRKALKLERKIYRTSIVQGESSFYLYKKEENTVYIIKEKNLALCQ